MFTGICSIWAWYTLHHQMEIVGDHIAIEQFVKPHGFNILIKEACNTAVKMCSVWEVGWSLALAV